MLNQKAIDKQYLLNSLKNFDKEILSKKYLNNDMGIKGDKGEPGENGITPHIGTNGNWYIGETDTGVIAQGQEGRSITNISKDDNNNIIVVFSDGTTKNIGKLTIDIQADFLTEEGFGNLRYYNGHFQYYNLENKEWTDTSITPDNVYILNMMPQTMKSMVGLYDTASGHYKLMYEEPADTIIDGQVSCVVEKVVIRRKQNEEPKDENDGILVKEISRSGFGAHKSTWYYDESFSPETGEKWFYKAFPVSTTGFCNKSSENSTGGMPAKDYYLFGFQIDQNESDPDRMITYIEDNHKFRQAHMDSTTDMFDYGSWADEWFMQIKPCMLKYDGTVDYELDPDDYTRKTDGTASDIADLSYEGNAMIGFPKTYWKIVDNEDNTANIYICNKKLDDTFHCWSHLDRNGREIDYCYMPIYNGIYDGTKMRSMSDSNILISFNTARNEVYLAELNNQQEDKIWYTEVFSDRMLINLLLLLIGKSTNTTAVFGNGNNNSFVSTSNTGVKATGTMNTKGLFWGNTDNTTGVKVFGMEHWWGNMWRRIAGHINDRGIQKIKLTYGQEDGSTVDGYNFDGNGYIALHHATPTGTNGGYLSKMQFNENGLIPINATGSLTTYYTNIFYFENSQVNYCLVSNCTADPFRASAFLCSLMCVADYSEWYIGASLSCKPLATASSIKNHKKIE